MDTPFIKMHGCGNDFVVFDARERPVVLDAARCMVVADRRRGVGCDQVIVLEPCDGADVFMRIRNPDGSEAGACGNATRCVASLLGAESGRRELSIRTISGTLPARIGEDGLISVGMGAPRLEWQQVPLDAPADTLHLALAEGPVADPAACSMGNPHATFFVRDVAGLPLESLGPKLEHAPVFPDRANIGFAEILAPDRIRLRVWERGAGLTLACGSGACAAVVNAARRGLTGRRISVQVDGGVLEIDWRESGQLVMTGPAAEVFRGSIALDGMAA